MEAYFDRLWPIMRSITGEGVRQTLDILSEIVPLKRHSVKSGTPALDWVVPEEWRFRSAQLKTLDGEVVLDANANNLHLVNYSIPFHGTVPIEELQKHLFSLPEQPEAIPYVTSYYKPFWGFCLSENQRKTLTDPSYVVEIDTQLHDGVLDFADLYIPGETEEEIFFSSYICHPSMANNELSGPLVTAFLARELQQRKNNKYSYRFLFIPETIGSIVYLSKYGEHLRRNLRAGYVLTCIGDRADFSYKKSRRGDTAADKIAMFALEMHGYKHTVHQFFPDTGSDERQFCSPGFNLPVGSFIRSIYATYPEYHTSLDNKDFICFEKLDEAVQLGKQVCDLHELDMTYVSSFQFGEPNFGRRGLYPTLSEKGKTDYVRALFWIANYSDGFHSIVDIAQMSKLPAELLSRVAMDCVDKGLLTGKRR